MKKYLSVIIFVLCLALTPILTACNNVCDETIVSVTSVTINGPDTIMINIGEQYTAIVLPENATNKVITWTVTSGTATFSQTTSGLLTATAAGTVIITATAGGITSVQKTITVNNPEPTICQNCGRLLNQGTHNEYCSICNECDCGIDHTPIPTRKTFVYVYNEATGNNEIENIEIKQEDLEQTSFIVPTREDFIFKGWYLDWLFTAPVSNEHGELIIGDDIFKTSSTQLFAKWLYSDYATYEILMVFVTEVNATLQRHNGDEIIINYEMSETEKQVYLLLSTMFEQYLNALLNGLVVFEVDTFFTTEPLSEENFLLSVGSAGDEFGLFYNYSVFGFNIPEIGGNTNGYDTENVGGRLCDYRSVITTFSVNDYEGLLRTGAGSGLSKYASIHSETLFNGLESPELLLDETWEWRDERFGFFMDHYLHEFTHTVEMQSPNYENNTIDFHGVDNYYSKKLPRLSDIEIIRLYLLDLINIPGQIAGIPFSFWKGD